MMDPSFFVEKIMYGVMVICYFWFLVACNASKSPTNFSRDSGCSPQGGAHFKSPVPRETDKNVQEPHIPAWWAEHLLPKHLTDQRLPITVHTDQIAVALPQEKGAEGPCRHRDLGLIHSPLEDWDLISCNLLGFFSHNTDWVRISSCPQGGPGWLLNTKIPLM